MRRNNSSHDEINSPHRPDEHLEEGILLLDVDGSDIQEDKGRASRWASLTTRLGGLRFTSGAVLADRISAIAQGPMRWAAYLLVIRVLINASIIYYNFLNYRRTMPLGWWLDASGEKLLYHLEFIILNMYLASATIHFLQGVRLRQHHQHQPAEGPCDLQIIACSHLCYAGDAINSAAGFWFGMACPRMAYAYRAQGVLGAVFKDEQASTGRKALLVGCCLVCVIVYSWFGFLAVLVYIRRYPFISETAVTDWSYWQVSLCLLVNIIYICYVCVCVCDASSESNGVYRCYASSHYSITWVRSPTRPG